jgi:hypothetical protein
VSCAFLGALSTMVVEQKEGDLCGWHATIFATTSGRNGREDENDGNAKKSFVVEPVGTW